MYDQRTSHEVSQPAVLGIQQHGDNPHPIKTRKPTNWIRVSAKMAIKRLPRLASPNSRCTCSGVSMVSLSVATMISTYWLEKRKSHWLRLERLLDQSHQHGLRSLTRSELQE